MKTTTDPTTPALLSAAEIEEIRERHTHLATAIAIDRDLTPDEEVEAEQDMGALLRHLAALTPPAPADGGEALGRGLFFALHPGGDLVWKHYEDESKAPWIAAAIALDAHGYARGRAEGRSEGEAERARLRDDVRRWSKLYSEGAALLADRDATIARLTAELAAAHDRALAHGVAVVASTERAMQVQIDALAAELAEARATLASVRERHEEERADLQREIAESESMLASSAADRDTARHDGAREERRLTIQDMLAVARETHPLAQPAVHEAMSTLGKRIKSREPGARGEGQGS